MITLRTKKHSAALLVLTTIFLALFFTANGFSANYPLEITNIKPAGTGSPAIPAINRIFRAYPGIPYNIRAAVIGGLYPFTYSLSNAPAGMTINAATGEINWPNPQSNSGTITLTVTDAEGTVRTTTWAITVSTSGFVFVDGSYGGTQTGSLAQPYNSISNMLAGTSSTTTIVYFRTGTYALFSYNPIGTGDMYLAGKPHYWMAYPGETVTLSGSSGAHIRSDVAVYIDGFRFSNFTNHCIMLWGGHHYQTIRRCIFDTISANSSVNENYGFIYTTSASGASGYYDVIQNNEFKNFTGASAIGSLYDPAKLLIENNYIHDDLGAGVSDLRNGISAKYRTHQLTVRGNIVVMNDGWPFGRGGMNGPMEGAIGSDVSFNYFRNLSGAIVHELNGSGDIKDFYYYRNTSVGRTQFNQLSGSSCAGPITMYQNLVVNGNADVGGTTAHDYLFYHPTSTNSPWNCVTDTSNLKVLPSSNAVDSNGLLQGSYTSYLGTRGWQLADGSTPYVPSAPPTLPKSPMPPTGIKFY